MTGDIVLDAGDIEKANEILESTRLSRPTATVNDLLENWRRAILSLEGGYRELNIWDYDEDLVRRGRLEEVVDQAPSGLRAKLVDIIEPLDKRFRELTVETERTVLLSETATQWWFFRIPRTPHATLKEGLEARGLLERKGPSGDAE
jgi:hypothetical protein